MQRTARRYHDDSHEDVGLRMLLLAEVIRAARALPPQTNTCRTTKKRGTGRKYSQLRVV